MAIAVGDRLPDVELFQMTRDGPSALRSSEVFAGKRVVLFALPGAFTPVCSARHLPGYVENAFQFRRLGIDTVACIAVNDAFVMGAWARDQNVGQAVLMLADGNGSFTRAVGLQEDRRGRGMGMRSRRYALVAEDGLVRALVVEPPGAFGASAAEAMLEQVRATAA